MNKSRDSEFYLTIHGHFYQPPRENPWTETIARQESAAPYHDWNERIAAECYTPNSASRILDSNGRILDIVNNYEKISFNFGPTLLSWLQEKEPETYQLILQADKISQELFSGHGNAIAQAFNHTILPLTNHRDKETQVKWGLEDFRYRFGREAEAIWLPETAVNAATLKVLVEHGLKFVILSPYQAERVRPLNGSSEWENVVNGEIDVTLPYRCFLKGEDGEKIEDKYIDIFFYHGALSRGVGFEHLLRDARTLASRIQRAFSNQQKRPQLISICTDGESYGHHEPFGDMGLAYLLNIEAPQRGLKITNYGEFLEKNPPLYEVELKPGPKGEGTSWSCSHGVGRWYRDCGCSTGGLQEWNQKWRWHLRRALDQLRDELILIFEEKGSQYFSDVWKARNDYIHVLLNRSEENLHHFFEKHGKNQQLTKEDRIAAINLMEMQRHAMLMYTSCGWFFSEISGLETVQILNYADRAIELGEMFGGKNLELKLLAELSHAKSNLARFGNGNVVYKKLVKPSIVHFSKVVNHYAIRSYFREYETTTVQIYHYRIQKIDYEKHRKNSTTLIISHVRLISGITTEERDYAFALFCQGKQKFNCFIRELYEEESYKELKMKTKTAFSQSHGDFLELMKTLWGEEILTLKDMFSEEREKILDIILEKEINELRETFTYIYEKNIDLFETLSDMGVSAPTELRAPAESTLSLQLQKQIEGLKDVTDEARYADALNIVKTAHRYGFKLRKDVPSAIFQQMLENKAELLSQNLNLNTCVELIHLLEIAEKLGLTIKETRLQNYVFKILKNKLMPLIDKIISSREIGTEYELVTWILQLAYKFNFNIQEYKERLKPLEENLSRDPQFWP